MPAFCCVINCGNRGERDNVKFYKIPKILNFKHKEHINKLSKVRREKWINAIKREDLVEAKLKYATVCSKHFISGKPADREDVTHPDWVPHLNLGHGHKLAKEESHGEAVLKRFQRAQKRAKLVKETQVHKA
ncbi:hypothetical protein NQ315_012997, partial [Exocentrus adspersus]